MLRIRRFRSRPLALALVAAWAAAPLAAHAAAVTLTAFETLGSASGPGTNVMDGNASGGDFFRSSTSGSDSSFFHTYGFTTGLSYFGARVSGIGTFYGKTSATFTDSFFNSSGSAQLVNFAFNVDSGQIGLSGSGSGFADLLLRVKFGSTVVAQDHGRIASDGTTTTCDSNVGGGDVGPLGSSYLACSGTNSAFGAAQAYSVSQLVNPGDTLSVTYDIIAETAGTLSGAPDPFCSSGPGQNGGPGITAAGGPGDGVPHYSGCTFFNGISRSGDPAGFSAFTPGSFSLTASVPEPGSVGLAALALLGLAATARPRTASRCG